MSAQHTIDAPSKSDSTTYLKQYEVPVFLIESVNLTINLQEDETIVTAEMAVRRNEKSKNKSHDFILIGEDVALLSLKINGELVDMSRYDLQEDKLIIKNVPNLFDIETVVRIEPQNNTQLSGLYRSQDTFCTQCEAEGFRRITYFLDRPDVLARYKTTIFADKKKYPMLLSNGNLIATGDEPNGRHFAIWEDPFPKPSYLFAMVAGDFDLLQDTFTTMSGRHVTLSIYVDKGYLNATEHAMYAIKEAMRWDEKHYGREYDLDIFMIVAISDFNMGAMENKGLNIFNTKYIIATPATATDDNYILISSVIAHEYFHNWSGNRVTCRDWFQLSLKEGLTIFRDQSFSEDTLSKAVMRIRDVRELRETQFPEDASSFAHPVQPDHYIEIDNFYTPTIYNKGAEVLRMLQTLIGKEVFRKGMNQYFETFDGKAVTIEDFIVNMEAVSHQDLSQFRLWYTQAGTPIVTVTDEYDRAKKTYTLTLTQNTPPTPGQKIKQPLHIPVRMGLINKNGDVVAKEQILQLKEEKQHFVFENITAHPIPSLFRDFSAPIKLDIKYSQSDLLFLARYDQDPFNRYEAAQAYFLRVILQFVLKEEQDQPISLPNECVQLVSYLMDHENDLFLLAEMLTLPTEQYIGDQMEVVSVNAIHEARQHVIHALAYALKPHFEEQYHRYHQHDTYQFNIAALSKRQWKNRCLSYLSTLREMQDMVMAQFTTSLTSSMTNTLPALVCLSNVDTPLRQKALDAYLKTWREHPLAMDNWFAVQAKATLPDTLSTVKMLTTHPQFNIKNPNKVYALIGGFSAHNPYCFHNKNGEGYAFLGEIVKQLDKLNPQVAARMVKPLTRWKRYDKERQDMMKRQLAILLEDKNISPNLFELVSKSL